MDKEHFLRRYPMSIRKHPTSSAAENRQSQIEDCLLQNLEVMPYHAITVADLCRQLQISRRAFYLYFPDKDACLFSAIDKRIRDSLLHIMPLSGTDSLKISTKYFAYWKEQGNFLTLMQRQNLDGLFRERYARYFSYEEQSLFDSMTNKRAKSDPDILYACMDLRSGFLLRWCARGFDTPVEEIAKKYWQLISTPIVRMSSDSPSTPEQK